MCEHLVNSQHFDSPIIYLGKMFKKIKKQFKIICFNVSINIRENLLFFFKIIFNVKKELNSSKK